MKRQCYYNDSTNIWFFCWWRVFRAYLWLTTVTNAFQQRHWPLSPSKGRNCESSLYTGVSQIANINVIVLCTLLPVVLFIKKKKNKIAVRLVTRIVNGSIYRDSNGILPSFNEFNDIQNTKVGEVKTIYNVVMRLKHVNQKFLGDLAQCWYDHKDEFEEVTADFDLSNHQRFPFLHNILCKDAHSFYHKVVEYTAT